MAMPGSGAAPARQQPPALSGEMHGYAYIGDLERYLVEQQVDNRYVRNFFVVELPSVGRKTDGDR
jgi:hypothetical protein